MNSLVKEQIEYLSKAHKAYANKDFETAELAYRDLISNNVQLPKVYSQLALICWMSNRIPDAKNLWVYALELDPSYIDALMGLGNICKYERNFVKAADFYQKATVENPKFALAHLNLSFSLKQIGKLVDSERACKSALEIAPNYIQAEDFLGQILVSKGDLDQAQQVFEKLLSENPKNIKALYALGNIFKSQGEFKKACAYYQKIFSIQPKYSQAHFTYSSIYKYIDKKDPHIELMLEQYKIAERTSDSKIQLSFALAKAFEDIQDYDEAFKYLEEGNQLRFARYNYNIESDEVFVKSIIESFNTNSLNNLDVQATTSGAPIFIVGMPRSGTSLVEKILSTHTNVHAGGELDYFFQLGTQNLLTESSNYLFTPINNVPRELLENIGLQYIEKIKLLNSESRYTTDKLPFNFLLIGLIKKALPNARIIHCVRDAKDNCLSIYKKNFTTDNYRFAYNLKTLGQFHNLYSQLMEHWHSTFPHSIIDIKYESLVSNSEIEIKKLIAACDLEWQEECLNFHKSEAIVNTASAYQVRQPIYDSSIGIWTKYKSYLTPLFSELKSN
jgi:tetratricopeptide (TPR) repeat protein